MGRVPLDRGAAGLGEDGQLTPDVAWRAIMADREEGVPGALESLRPWLVASAIELVHDRQLAALVAQQVMVDLTARTGHAVRAPEELEQWLRVRLTQTSALFTGSAWIGTGADPDISSSIPSALALGAGWRLAAWTRRFVPHMTFRPRAALVTSFTAALAVALVASGVAASYSLGSNSPPPGSRTQTTINSPSGVPFLISPITVAQQPTPTPPSPSPAPASPPSVPTTTFTAVVQLSSPSIHGSANGSSPRTGQGTITAPPPPPLPRTRVTTPTRTPTPTPTLPPPRGSHGSPGDTFPSPPGWTPVGWGRGDSPGDSGVPDLPFGRPSSQWPDDSGLPNGPGSGGPVLGWTQGPPDRH